MFLNSIPIFLLFFLVMPFSLIMPWKIIRVFLLAIPIVGGFQILNMELGSSYTINFMGLNLELVRFDKLTRIFSLIFCLAAFLGNLYAWHVKDKVQQVASIVYSGAAIGAVFAGDLVTLFFFWEGTAIASVFLIWARRTEGSYYTGMRYLIIQIISGLILLMGTILHYKETGSIAFTQFELQSFASWLIFISFGIKCAFPLLHNWLQDSYPAATVTGTVILSAFTTKLAVYALARSFPGTEILIYIGAAMTLFPIFFAEIENDLRRVLAYSLNNQLGFMVVGIGIGTEMALNGTASHAFAHILYKALLFMSVGAVLFRTGTSKASELGGLYRTMPLTAIFCLVGAASISAFPLFSGFVTKSLIMDQTANQHYEFIWFVLVFASAGVLSHSGIKVPFFAFFSHDSGLRPKEAPKHMLLAMGLTSALCIIIGVAPVILYDYLPYEVNYKPYTSYHVINQLQLLCFAILSFILIKWFKMLPKEIRSINIDSDIIYRKALPMSLAYLVFGLKKVIKSITEIRNSFGYFIITILQKLIGSDGSISRIWSTGNMVLWIAIVLSLILILNYSTI